LIGGFQNRKRKTPVICENVGRLCIVENPNKNRVMQFTKRNGAGR